MILEFFILLFAFIDADCCGTLHILGIKKENGVKTILMNLIGTEMIVNTDIDIDIADRKKLPMYLIHRYDE